MQYNTKNSNKVTALYARFSRNDSDNESDSIANQRKILQNYAKEKGFTRTKFYADDGISGTTFDRPDFQRLLTDIENGEVKTVIVKDLSRFGRLSSMVGYYTDFYFPQNSIRFIAIIDDVDSDNGDNEFAPFKNIFNEWYARDTSRKVRETLKNKGENGGILCTRPIYGYKKDPNNKKHWLIDEEAAETVRLIYNLFTEECLGVARITNTLRDKEIITPTEYFRRNGLAKRELRQSEVYFWAQCTVREILKNQLYTGDVVNFKTYRKSFKDHKTYWNPPENLVIYKGVNEPIISEEQFLKVQAIFEKRKRIPTDREPDLFQGIVICADCGKRMSMNRRQNYINSYVCNTYRRNSKACKSHYIRRDVLGEEVLKKVRKLIVSAKKNPERFSKKLKSAMHVQSSKEVSKAKAELEKLNIRQAEIDRIISQLYEDKALGIISEERFLSIALDFEKQQIEIKNKAAEYNAALSDTKQNGNSIDSFIETIRKYDDVTELNQYVLLDLIDKIVISQRDEGQPYEEIIDVYFKAIGNIFFE